MFVMAAIVLSTSAIASAQYKFVKLTVPGAAQTIPVGINNNNLVVGYYAEGSATYGFSYNPSTKKYQYPINKANFITEAMAVNNAGTIVGAYATAPTSGYFGLVDNGGSLSEYQEPGCSGTQVTGINDYPTMVGSCSVVRNGQTIKEGWIGTPWNTTYSCPNATATLPVAINNWAISGGSIYYGTGQNITVQGFLATDSGTCQIISYPGAAYTSVGGLNDDGQISGTYWASASGSSQGFLINGSTYSTLNVPKSKATSLNQINNNKWIVGTFVRKNVVYGFVAEPISGASILVDSDK
jgi:hypothetical protein